MKALIHQRPAKTITASERLEEQQRGNNVNVAVGHLTCTIAEGKAQPPLGTVEDHVETFHHSRTDHQTVDRRGHPETEAVQRSVHVGDLLDIKL